MSLKEFKAAECEKGKIRNDNKSVRTNNKSILTIYPAC